MWPPYSRSCMQWVELGDNSWRTVVVRIKISNEITESSVFIIFLKEACTCEKSMRLLAFDLTQRLRRLWIRGFVILAFDRTTFPGNWRMMCSRRHFFSLQSCKRSNSIPDKDSASGSSPCGPNLLSERYSCTARIPQQLRKVCIVFQQTLSSSTLLLTFLVTFPSYCIFENEDCCVKI